MQFMFVHGWGSDARMWDSLLAELALPSETPCISVNLGFIGTASDAKEAMECLTADTICVGHSLGVLWLLKHLPRDIAGLISIAGFDRFEPEGGNAVLKQMQDGLEHNMRAQMKAFWRNAHMPLNYPPEELNYTRLRNGLEILQEWDAREEVQRLACPILALASTDDKVVTANMSRAVWPEHLIRWSPTGGHMLPLTEPQWCVRHIRSFLHDL